MNADKAKNILDVLKELSGQPDISESQVLADLGFTTSLRLLRLQSRLEKAGKISLPPLAASTSMLKVLRLCGAENTRKQEEAERPPEDFKSESREIYKSAPQPSSGKMEIGTDIEEIDALPDAEDYREHEFYRTIFTPKELAYSLLFSEPKPHLAGMFCAKEAARKTFPEMIALEMRQIEVFRIKGKPHIRLLDTPLAGEFEFSASISHSKNFATASVLASTNRSGRL